MHGINKNIEFYWLRLYLSAWLVGGPGFDAQHVCLFMHSFTRTEPGMMAFACNPSLSYIIVRLSLSKKGEGREREHRRI